MMGAVFRVAGNRWVRTLLGALLLSALIWLFGPLIGIGSLHPLDSETVRILVIAAIFVLWLVFNLVQVIRAHRRDQELAKGVAESAPDADAAASAEEIATLSERLKDAFAALRKARIGGKSRGYLYQLPWYMFIGPPGAGKTTALTHCGLNFPLADTHGPLAVRGVGGTRNCDWWFTDQAVLIDTAGRYTTQDSNRAVDSAAWLGFLRLLKRYRRRQPLNGVLLAIGLADLAALSRGRPACSRANDPPPHPRAARRARRAHPRLRAVHQGRSDRRLRRILRQSRQGGARAGLGHDLPARRRQGRERHRRAVRAGIRCAARPAERPHARARAAGDRPATPAPDLRLSGAARLIARGRVRIPDRNLPPEPA